MLYQSALVKVYQEVILLDEAYSLTLSVILFYQSALVKVYQEVILLDEAYSLTLGVISLISASASRNLSGSKFTSC